MAVDNINRFTTDAQFLVLIDDGVKQDFNRQLDKDAILQAIKPNTLVALMMLLPYHQAHPSRELVPHHRVYASFIDNDDDIKQTIIDVSDEMWTVLPDHLIIPPTK
jgi:hypothetical protein